MKVVHLDKEKNTGSLADQLKAGKAEEEQKEYDKAIKTYRYVIKKYPLNEFAYQRLMILYRKKKDYQNELKIIEEALANHEKNYHQKKSHAENSKISQLSRQLMKSTGLTDKRGKRSYLPEPLNRWTKRKISVERLAGNKKNR